MVWQRALGICPSAPQQTIEMFRRQRYHDKPLKDCVLYGHLSLRHNGVMNTDESVIKIKIDLLIGKTKANDHIDWFQIGSLLKFLSLFHYFPLLIPLVPNRLLQGQWPQPRCTSSTCLAVTGMTSVWTGKQQVHAQLFCIRIITEFKALGAIGIEKGNFKDSAFELVNSVRLAKLSGCSFLDLTWVTTPFHSSVENRTRK